YPRVTVGDVPLLRVRDVEVVYGGAVLVLRGVNVEVPLGGIVAVLGANGAGKTTLLRAITGLLGHHRGAITRGTIELDGERPDEPSLGLAPMVVDRIRDIIVEVNGAGTSVVLVEQHATMALSIATSGYVLETGRVVKEGPAADLRDDADIREFYLGMAAGERRSFREVKSYRRKKSWSL